MLTGSNAMLTNISYKFLATKINKVGAFLQKHSKCVLVLSSWSMLLLVAINMSWESGFLWMRSRHSSRLQRQMTRPTEVNAREAANMDRQTGRLGGGGNNVEDLRTFGSSHYG